MSEFNKYTGRRVEDFGFSSLTSGSYILSGCRRVEVSLSVGSVQIFDKNDNKITISKVGESFVVEARNGYLLPEFNIQIPTGGEAKVVFYEGEIKTAPKSK